MMFDDGLIRPTEGVWRFTREDSPAGFRYIRFLPGGEIKGYNHPDGSTWRLEEGRLSFLSDTGKTTVIFSHQKGETGAITLSGDFTLNMSKSIAFRLEQSCWVDRDVFPNSTNKLLKDQIEKLGWQIGDHTYGRPAVHAIAFARLKIGKFCSIAAGVDIFLGAHRTDFLSTYPFAILEKFWPSKPPGVSDHTSKGDVTIGNDVWIGSGAIIMSGVTIGDGAVIGARAVVTRDVPPYAIVVGNPARVLRHRFEQSVVERLLQAKWWNWPDEVVDASLPLLLSTNIEAFIKLADERLVNDARDIVLHDGDSITLGFGCSKDQDYPNLMKASVPVKIRQYNDGVNGMRLLQRVRQFNESAITKAYDAGARNFIVVVALGSNDFRDHLRAGAVYAALREYLHKARKLGANVSVVVCSVLPRIDLSEDQRKEIGEFNQLLKDGWLRAPEQGGWVPTDLLTGTVI